MTTKKRKPVTAKARPKAVKPKVLLGDSYFQGSPSMWNPSDAKHIPHSITFGNEIWMASSAWQKPAYQHFDFRGFLKKASLKDLRQELKYQESTYGRIHNLYAVGSHTESTLAPIKDAITRLQAEIKKRSSASATARPATKGRK